MKNVIITGASRGIGYSLTQRFLEEGHRVFAISRSIKNLKELSEKYPRTLSFTSLDFSRINKLEIIKDYIFEWDRIDILYNNAGHLIKKPFTELSALDFEDTWKVNFLSPSLLIQNCMSKMDENSHIVNITTMGGVQGSVKFPELSAYAASKASLINLTEVLAVELEGKPCINAIALGSVDTEMFNQAFPDFNAGMSVKECTDYLFNFGTVGHKYQNGKIIQLTKTTP